LKTIGGINMIQIAICPHNIARRLTALAPSPKYPHREKIEAKNATTEYKISKETILNKSK
jgi:hypothetical protein